MENIRKRSNIYLETDPDHFLRQTAKPTFVSCKIFHENLVAIHMKKNFLLLDKPSYVGMCILDLSKVLMYDFHYNFIKEKYGDRAKLLFTDTDSLCYHILTDDVYEDLYNHKDLFDNSDYSKSSKFYFDENKKVIGKFKDEAAGNPITSFIGHRSKMYSYEVELPGGEIKNNKACKGISKNVVKRDIDHKDYLSVLQNKTIEKHKMKTIRSDHHVVSSYEINKISLSCFDDKRYILDDGITTYAYGHKKNNCIIFSYMTTNIIGFAGKLGTGKDYIIEKYLSPLIKENKLIVAFADYLKIKVASENDDIDIADCIKSNKPLHVRKKLQKEGTENGRNIYGDDIWIKKLENFIYLHNKKNNINTFIISDCRFINEADWIENKMSGLLIYVNSPNRNRKALKLESKNNSSVLDKIKSHRSENELNNYPFKYIINNDDGDAKYQLEKIIDSFYKK